MPDAGFERLVNDFPDVIEAYIIGDAGEDMVGVDESFFAARLILDLRAETPVGFDHQGWSLAHTLV